MDTTYRIPSLAEVINLSHEDAVALYESIVPIAAILRARIVARGELTRPVETRVRARQPEPEAPAPEPVPVEADVAELEHVDLIVERVNNSGRVIFQVPGRGLASAIPTAETRKRFARLRPGQVLRVHRAEVAVLPRSGGRQVLRRVALRG